MTRRPHRLARIAALSYAAGLVIGSGVSWAAWTKTSHEHQHRLRRQDTR